MAINQEQIKQPKSPSKIIAIPSLLFEALAMVFLSIVLSIIIEWVGMFFNYWGEDTYYHAKNIFTTELNWVLGDSLAEMQILSNFYSSSFEYLNHYLINESGLSLAATGQLSISLLWMIVVSIFFTYLANFTKFNNDIIFKTFLSIMAILPILFLVAVALDIMFELHFLTDYIFAMVYVIQLTIVRLLTILFSLPVFMLLMLYIVADGMYQRQIRKLSGAMESAFIYHHSKRWIKPLIGLPMVLLLSSPIAVHPSVFVLVVTLTPGIFVLITVKYFKKYV
jgi:hypothetical protein